MRVKVSVIMIAYNQEATIGEAIRSVVKQRAPFAFELIVADDASTDSTAAVAEEWQRRYPDIVRVIRREKNLGLQANFLDAWSRVKGEYVAICEGDDHWSSASKLRRQAEWLDAHPDYSLVFHRVWNHYADTKTLSLSNPRQQTDITLEDLARGNVITNLSVMYRAIPFGELPEWIREIKLFDYAFHSLHLARGKGRFIGRPMAVYRRYSRGIWSGDPQRAGGAVEWPRFGNLHRDEFDDNIAWFYAIKIICEVGADAKGWYAFIGRIFLYTDCRINI